MAVVGSRKASDYGQQVTRQICRGLAQAGITIVSGLALGIDACSHQTALDNRAKTIAVLGSGLDTIYPAANLRLAEKIIDHHGCVISEFPLGTPAYKSNFPQRNRIIAGLCLGTLVVEASFKSGALITARYALEQNREVFTVPGSIYNLGSQGPHSLIKNGARLITDAEEILESLNLQRANDFKNVKEIVPENETEKLLLTLIATEPIHIDKLVKLSELTISQLNASLTLLEMKGAIKNLGGQKYAKAR